MKLSRNCACTLIILSAVLLMSLAFAVSLMGFFAFFFPIGQEEMTSLLETISCREESMTKEIYQHGNYWVLKNIIRAEPDRNRCGQVTLTMQGTVEEVYKLEYLFLDGLSQESVSFAVYIPTAKHLIPTLRAIAYVRNCIRKQESNNIFVHFIQKYVTFHLYFHMGNLPLDSGVKDIEAFVNQHTECATKPAVPSTHVKEIVDSYKREHAVIVGRNIAQLAAATKFILRTDADTYPSAGLINMLSIESALVHQISASARRKLVFRLPTFIISQMQTSVHVARESSLNFSDELRKNTALVNSYNWAEYDSLKWLLTRNSAHTIYNFRGYRKELFTTYSYFISTKDVPLLDERRGFSLLQSEDLRLFDMSIKNYTFTVAHEIYVLHIQNEKPGQMKSRLADINEKILDEYFSMHLIK